VVISKGKHVLFTIVNRIQRNNVSAKIAFFLQKRKEKHCVKHFIRPVTSPPSSVPVIDYHLWTTYRDDPVLNCFAFSEIYGTAAAATMNAFHCLRESDTDPYSDIFGRKNEGKKNQAENVKKSKKNPITVYTIASRVSRIRLGMLRNPP
jgi:hypothetical protein